MRYKTDLKIFQRWNMKDANIALSVLWYILSFGSRWSWLQKINGLKYLFEFDYNNKMQILG